MVLIIVDVISTVVIVNIVKSNFSSLPLYIYSGIGGSIGVLGALIYLPLYYKLKGDNMNG